VVRCVAGGFTEAYLIFFAEEELSLNTKRATAEQANIDLESVIGELKYKVSTTNAEFLTMDATIA